MKTFLIAAALSASAFAFGWHGDDIAASVGSQFKAEVSAVVNHFRYDPEREARKCLATARHASYCKPHTKAWMERDGEKNVFPISLSITMPRIMSGQLTLD
jgi:hypothetical protein